MGYMHYLSFIPYVSAELPKHGYVKMLLDSILLRHMRCLGLGFSDQG